MFAQNTICRRWKWLQETTFHPCSMLAFLQFPIYKVKAFSAKWKSRFRPKYTKQYKTHLTEEIFHLAKQQKTKLQKMMPQSPFPGENDVTPECSLAQTCPQKMKTAGISQYWTWFFSEPISSFRRKCYPWTEKWEFFGKEKRRRRKQRRMVKEEFTIPGGEDALMMTGKERWRPRRREVWDEVVVAKGGWIRAHTSHEALQSPKAPGALCYQHKTPAIRQSYTMLAGVGPTNDQSQLPATVKGGFFFFFYLMTGASLGGAY